MRLRRREAAPERPESRAASISPDEVVRQNERSRGGLLLDEEPVVTMSQVDLNASVVPQIRALLRRS